MHSDPDLNRGGNTFVFDIQALRDAPNAVPEIAGRPTRRSDMIWALLQRAQFGRTVVTVPIGVYHDRRGLPMPVVLDEQSIADDIRGFAPSGRAPVCTPVTHAHLVSRLPLAKQTRNTHTESTHT